MVSESLQARNDERTCVAALASHDCQSSNEDLWQSLTSILEDPDLTDRYRFVFTGGTFDRLFVHPYGADREVEDSITHSPGSDRLEVQLPKLSDAAIESLAESGVVRLPNRKEGGVTLLAHLVAQRKISIVWPFLSPLTLHWLSPQNLALLRLCDHWRVKKLMNTGSVSDWLQHEAKDDALRSRLAVQSSERLDRRIPCIDRCLLRQSTGNAAILPDTRLPVSSMPFPPLPGAAYWRVEDRIEPSQHPHVLPPDQSPQRLFIALIAHDHMKERMIDFVVDYEQDLATYRSILTTGTTGRLAREAAPSLADKICAFHSGPKGGDVEIATHILMGQCDVVVFFVDPLRPHPHIDDVRVVFAAAMLRPKTIMLTNEFQAREWMHTH